MPKILLLFYVNEIIKYMLGTDFTQDASGQDRDRKKALHGAGCVGEMRKGSEFFKVTDSTKNPLKAYFFLDSEMKELKWKPKFKKENAKIVLTTISEINHGTRPDTLERTYDASCCVTIAHGQPVSRICLIAKSPQIANVWATGLRYLVESRKTTSCNQSETKLRLSQESRIRNIFDQADKNGDGKLNIEEICLLMKKLNVNLSKRKVKNLFKEIHSATESSESYLVYDEFISFYRKVAVRKELIALISNLSNEKNVLSVTDFQRFLQTEQSMNDVTKNQCASLIAEFEPLDGDNRKNHLGIQGFTNFLLSPHCDIIDPDEVKLNKNAMGHPLSYYFVNSSHNTYLLGDQLTSQSSSAAYAKALSSGCRCVELDCWDGPSGEPIIHHGFTFTSKISFYDVIRVIDEYAFAKNPYPVILSIENHCSLDQQHRMAEIMKGVFGEKLDVCETECVSLPSPESLKGKILIKCKKLSKDVDPGEMGGEVSEEDSEDEKYSCVDSDENNKRALPSPLSKPEKSTSFRFKWLEPMRRSLRKHVLSSSSNNTESRSKSADTPNSEPMVSATIQASSSTDVSMTSQQPTKPSQRKVTKSFCQNRSILRRYSSFSKNLSFSPTGDETQRRERSRPLLSRHLSDLVTYMQSIKFTGFDSIPEGFSVWSFDETKATNLVMSKAQALIKLNHHRLSRIYPSARRIKSGNFNPVLYWNTGCQLVALNHQTKDENMELNDALFELNGRVGYVPKPRCLIEDNSYNPLNVCLPDDREILRLTIHVISGQQLPKPDSSVMGDIGEIIDPLVEIEIVGVDIDCCKLSTKVINDNGFNPIWNDTLEFFIAYPELAFVRFQVWDRDPIGRDFIGQRTVALKAMATGYRHVRLNQKEFASIFVKITKQYESPAAVLKKHSKLIKVTPKLRIRNGSLRRRATMPDSGKVEVDSRESLDGVSARDAKLTSNHKSTVTVLQPTKSDKEIAVADVGSQPTDTSYTSHCFCPVNYVNCDVKRSPLSSAKANYIQSKGQPASLSRICKRNSNDYCVNRCSKAPEDSQDCNTIRRSKKGSKMTLFKKSDRKKSSRITTYLLNLLRKKKKVKRSYADCNYDVAVNDAVNKKRSKTNKAGKFVHDQSSNEEPVDNSRKSFTLLTENYTIENSFCAPDNACETPQSTRSSTPLLCNKLNTNSSNNNNNNNNLDVNKGPQTKQMFATKCREKEGGCKQPQNLLLCDPADIYAELLRSTNQNSDDRRSIECSTGTKQWKRLPDSYDKTRRSKSFSEKIMMPQNLSKPSERPALKVFKPSALPKKIAADQRSRSVGNINLDTSKTVKNAVERLGCTKPVTEAKQSFVQVEKHKVSPKLKCKSLLDLTSSHLDKATDRDDVSKMIEKCCTSSYKKTTRSEKCKSLCMRPNSDLADKIIELTSVSPVKQPYVRDQQAYPFKTSTPVKKKVNDSDYVMLAPIPRPLLNRKTNDGSSLQRKLKLQNEYTVCDENYNLTPSKSLGSLDTATYGNPNVHGDTQFLYSSQGALGPCISPGIDYRAEVEEVLAKLRKSLKKDDEEEFFSQESSHSQNTSYLTELYRPENTLSLKKRSKSVEPIASYLSGPNDQPQCFTGADVGRSHQASRSRNRARNIAKKYSMYNSNENMLATANDNWWDLQSQRDLEGHDDYVYLSHPDVSLPVNNHTYEDKASLHRPSSLYSSPTRGYKHQNKQSSCGDYDVVMTSRSSDFYRLNLMVANSRRTPDGAENSFNPGLHEQRNVHRSNSLKWKSAAQPHIYYALDV